MRARCVRQSHMLPRQSVMSVGFNAWVKKEFWLGIPHGLDSRNGTVSNANSRSCIIHFSR